MQPPSNSSRHNYLTPFKPLTLHEINETKPVDPESRAADQEKNLADIGALIEKKDYQAALTICLKEEMQDNYEMIKYIELIPMEGKHTELANLFTICNEAAEWGSPVAAYIVGNMYERRMGVHENINKAIESYKNAYSKGFIPAALMLGRMYSNGNHLVAKDQKIAVAYLEKAEKAGVPWAASHLVYAYSVLNQYTNAFKICLKFANNENSWAWTSLGIMYWSTSSSKEDYVKARVCLEKAQHITGETGKTEEYLVLLQKKSFALIDKPGMEEAYVKFAAEFDLPSPVMYYNMGMSYLSGVGVLHQSHTKARRFLELSHNAGHPKAAFQLAESFRKASFMSGRRDESQAAQWYAVAAKQDVKQDVAKQAKQKLKEYFPNYELSNEDLGL